MPTSKYHREQAKILASLALSTRDAAKAERFNIAAMEHVAQADAMDDGTSHTERPSSDQGGETAPGPPSDSALDFPR